MEAPGSSRWQSVNRALTLAPIAALAIIVPLAPQAAAAKKDDPVRCTITGTKGDDDLRGTAGKDVICGMAGDDTISALGGDDKVFGLAGNDKVDGGTGSDHLFAGIGQDDLSGGGGADFLYGEKGHDRLIGGPAADALFGHLGNDRHRGGPGDDHISSGPGQDVGDPADRVDIEDCPAMQAPVCKFNMHVDISLYCPSYRVDVAACIGKTPYANPGWAVYLVDLPGIYGQFGWFPGPHGKQTIYNAVQPFVPTGNLTGWVPHDSAPQYAVEDAWTAGYLPTRWYTPLGKGPGEVAGPLYINFVNGYIGADVYLDGYLYKK